MLSSRESWDLLRQYVDHHDQAAFARLVDEHVDLVYSAAVRQVRDRQMADDVCQGVFILLADKAASMRPDVVLPAYLIKATYFISRNAIKRETRRRLHERKAAAMSAARTLPNDVSSNLAGLLDEGMHRLNDRERAAIVLRFFEQRTLAEAGQFLGVSEDAAAMRVSRALAKLRRFFEARRLTLTELEAGTILAAVAVRKAPPHVAPAAIEGATGATGATAAPSQVMSDLAADAAEAMKLEKMKSVACWTAAAAALILMVAGLLCHFAFTITRPLPRPPVEVW